MIKKFNRESWLAERRKGVGSSDCAAIMGLDERKTALHVLLDKRGELEDKEAADILELGLDMEPVILKRYERRTGLKPRANHQIAVHPRYPWMITTVDAKVGSPFHPLEIKHVLFPRGKWGDEGTDEIPTPIILQTQHQMAVTDTEYVELPVLIYGSLRIYRVERNERLIESIIQREEEFWNKYVIGQEPMPLDFQHPETLGLLKQIYSVDESLPPVELGEEAEQTIKSYLQLGQIEKQAKDAKDAAQAELLSLLGDASTGTLADRFIITRKTINRGAYEVKASSYVRMYVKELKEKEENELSPV